MTRMTAITNVNGQSGAILIEDDRIADIDAATVPEGAQVIDAQGAHVRPGIVDLGVFAVDKKACIAGGITRIALMPDQPRPLDDPGLVQRSALAAKPDLWVHPLAAATRGLEGRELAEYALMAKAGAKAIATGRHRIADSGVMLRVLSYARSLGLTVISHGEDEGLTAQAVATAGETASRHGLASAPAIAEVMAIARDVALVRETGAALHIRQVTTKAGFDLVRSAKNDGLPVTCGIAPTHLLLSDTAISNFRTFARLSPPLRCEADRRAAIEAVRDETVDIICSAHDPRGPEAKRLPFADAEPGSAGATTLLALSLGLVRDDVITMDRLFDLLSTNPSKLLGLDCGRIARGAPADLVIFAPDQPWQIDGATMPGQAGNTPFDKLPVQGRVHATIKGGRVLT